MIKRVTFTLSNQANSSVLKFQWTSTPSLSFIPATGHIKPLTSKDITVSFSSVKPLSLKAQKVIGKLSRITYSNPLPDVPDWDDSMKSIHWVNVPPPSATPTNPTSLEETSHSSTSASALAMSTQEPSKPPINPTSGISRMSTPAKRKVEEIEKEPSHAVVEDTYRDVEILVTAVTDYTKYECSVKIIQFKDTLMYQNRLYNFPLKNIGTTYLKYEWQVLNVDGTPPTPPPSHLQLDESGKLITEGGILAPFSVEPSSGTLLPEAECQITVKYSPLDAVEATYLLRCQ